MYCNNCGEVIEDGLAICSSCGTPVVGTNLNDSDSEKLNRVKKEELEAMNKYKRKFPISTVILLIFVIGAFAIIIVSDKNSFAKKLSNQSTTTTVVSKKEEAISPDETKSLYKKEQKEITTNGNKHIVTIYYYETEKSYEATLEDGSNVTNIYKVLEREVYIDAFKVDIIRVIGIFNQNSEIIFDDLYDTISLKSVKDISNGMEYIYMFMWADELYPVNDGRDSYIKIFDDSYKELYSRKVSNTKLTQYLAHTNPSYLGDRKNNYFEEENQYKVYCDSEFLNIPVSVYDDNVMMLIRNDVNSNAADEVKLYFENGEAKEVVVNTITHVDGEENILVNIG